ncbi:hypothetical protein ACN1T8_003796 [Vibrio cholerae]|uniref:hypothetical protein n=1 Tax=Vibrio cholerae TaxID=666 RepID=UPI001C931582|nr:hypothetical protein [Vibrio cholerae]MBY4642189.1 hypothetical protein [Vibrio cholerae]MCR9658461.1 hypothetical protein [Vibrio cholerae]MCR9689143.1 hypothetical protein [Vibrio cholerae]MCR9746474.1 hypothetical protein [Vibrio cholerae]
MTHNQIIAKTIIDQLGGGRFLAMTGAKNLVAINNGLQFDLPKTPHFVKDGISRIQVVLDASDTYSMHGMKYLPRKLENQSIAMESGIYADSLQHIFTNMTGLNTRLF